MKHILIVDDAATVRMYHGRILGDAGYAVDEAINGIEALEKALTRPFDLYLVDVNMPQMDGYSFLRELRSNGELPQAPAVMISTEGEARDQVAAFVAGANDYIVKPTRPADLLAHVRVLLGEPRP